ETNPAVGQSHPQSRRAARHFKDAFHRHIIYGEDTINQENVGTKSCFHYQHMVPAGGSVVVRLRVTPEALEAPLHDVDRIVEERRAEADDFYKFIHPPKASEDECRVQRQAFAGLLWTKQIYLFDVHKWLDGDNPADPPPDSRHRIRNQHWL